MANLTKYEMETVINYNSEEQARQRMVKLNSLNN